VNATARIAAAVAGGYLLGRTKKLKLAITVGSMLAGQRISTNPRELLRQGAQLIESNPELAKLSDQVRSQLLQALRAAAVSTAGESMNQLSDAIHNRTERLAVTQGQNESGEEEPEDESGEEEPEDEYDEGEEPEDAEESEGPEDSEEPEDSEDSEEPEDSEDSEEPEDSEDSEEPARQSAGRSSSKGARAGRSRTKKLPAQKPAKPPRAKKQTSKKSTSSRSRAREG